MGDLWGEISVQKSTRSINSFFIHSISMKFVHELHLGCRTHVYWAHRNLQFKTHKFSPSFYLRVDRFNHLFTVWSEKNFKISSFWTRLDPRLAVSTLVLEMTFLRKFHTRTCHFDPVLALKAQNKKSGTVKIWGFIFSTSLSNFILIDARMKAKNCRRFLHSKLGKQALGSVSAGNIRRRLGSPICVDVWQWGIVWQSCVGGFLLIVVYLETTWLEGRQMFRVVFKTTGAEGT